LVYYSLLAQGMTHQNIYYSYTTDFKTLTQPRVFYAPGYPVIDTDLYFSEYDGLYHMMIKKEAGSDVGIFEYTSPTLMGNDWTEILHMAAEGNAAVEGPTTIRRIDEDIYNLSYMRYDSEYKYKVVELDHMGLNYSTSTPLVGDGNFQHGSIIYVGEDEYNMLQLWSDTKLALRKAETIRDNEKTTIFDEAIALADKTLESNRTVGSLLENLPAALEALLKANADYIAADPDSYKDLTSMIANPHFAENSTKGWSGTGLTAAADHMAEQFDKTYDTYQDLPNMPAGNYILRVQGFYRYGLNGKPAHDNGTEELLAHYYINDTALPFMSLYDEEYLLFPNNTYSAGRAFNNDHKYENEAARYYLPEMGNIRIGIKKTTAMPQDWTAFDNFRLTYKPGEESGIGEVAVDRYDGEAVYFDLRGMRVENPAHGQIYIKKTGSHSEKVLLIK
ncbi:MAG: carbohydrate-binding protein, partial [Muribaculaceae bacterium]|nr:carbohydrate-binding protein [Muribaculaceae bacterium]